MKSAALLLCFVTCGLTANADVKVKSKSTNGGTSTESVTYIKGKRQRAENNLMIVTITQCDLQRTVELNPMTKTYFVNPFDLKNAPAVTTRNAKQPADTTPVTRGGIVTTAITTTDTGERKQMFGYTARHIKTAMVTESSPEACTQTKSRMETDGWYIDFNVEFNCNNQNSGGYSPTGKAGGCRDEYRTRQVGTARTGYPVQVTTTIFDENGKQSFSFTQEAVEISNTTLDAALFEIPADYTEVKDRQQLYSAAAMMSAARHANEDAPATNADAKAQNQTATTSVSQKKQGVVRVGILLPKVAATGEGMNSASLAEAARTTMVGALSGPTLEVVMLEARQPQQIEIEARQKECDYILSADLTHKRGGGSGLGGMLKKAAPLANAISYGSSSASTAAAVGVYTAANVASSIKAKDELSLDSRLQTLNGTVVLTNSQRAKAKSDSEDLLSNVINQAANVVTTAVMKK
jgi:hypothetical protein